MSHENTIHSNETEQSPEDHHEHDAAAAVIHEEPASSAEDSTDSANNDATKVSHTPIPPRTVLKSSWWWWELGGAIVALVGLTMTVAVLAVLDGKPTEKWTSRFDIQPNSLLSTLTTIGKLGMMLVVASCVSQLRWVHFERPNGLNHIDIFDEVSRASPLASLEILSKVKSGGDIVAAAFAFITLASFAIDPMVQQVLSLSSLELSLSNVTASMTASQVYLSNAAGLIGVGGGLANTTLDFQGGAVDLQWTLLLQLIHPVTFAIPLDCPYPATRCSWNTSTALGLCRTHTENIKANRSCTRHKYTANDTRSSNYMDCIYTPNNMNTTRNISMNFGGARGYTFDAFRSMLDIIDDQNATIGHQFVVGRMFTLTVPDEHSWNYRFLDNDSFPIPTVDIAMTEWYWCERAYQNVSLLHGKRIYDAPSITPLTISDIKYGSTPITVSTVNNKTVYSSGVAPIKALELTSSSTHKGYVTDFLSATFMRMFYQIDTRRPWYFDSGDLISFASVDELAAQTQIYEGGYVDSTNKDSYIVDEVGMAAFMSGANMSVLSQNLADAVTRQVQNDTDNQNFTTIRGIAFEDTPIYRVTWGWLVLPLLEAVATAALLFVTIWFNKLPLIKSSSIGMLAHAPEDAAGYRVSGAEAPEKWSKMGKTIDVVLAEDEKGWLRLVNS